MTGGLLEFLRMGGYAAFIWPCWILTAVVLAAMGWTSRRALRRTEETLARLHAEEPQPKESPR